MKTLFVYTGRFLVVSLINLIVASSASSQLFSNLHVFPAFAGNPNNTDGGHSKAGLALSDDTFYGVTSEGGTLGGGTVFAMKTDGTGYTNIHNFADYSGYEGFGPSGPATTNADGGAPVGKLLLSGNVLFGTTSVGGIYGSGTIFRINIDGTGFTNLYYFSVLQGASNGTLYTSTNFDGSSPNGGLVILNEVLYGSTTYGGPFGNGVIFSINSDGTGFTNLHSFSAFAQSSDTGYGTNLDGALPFDDLLLSGSTLYGTAYSGGVSGYGTVYKLGIDGSGFSVLYGFTNGVDGSSPLAGLIQSGDTLFGTASGVAPFTSSGAIFSIKTNGTDFTVIHTFGSNSILAYPYSALTMVSNVLYGVANSGTEELVLPVGTRVSGGVFSVKVDGSDYESRYAFSELSDLGITNFDGSAPYSQLVFTNNALYGTTYYGGQGENGTVFKLLLHPVFFNNEASLDENVYYLSFSNSVVFGYYNFDFFPYLYHYDLGFEYFIDANDGSNGAYLYDFTSGHFWYTNPADFPFIYDFSLNSWLYYFPDTQNAGHYTSNPRVFYNYATSQFFTQ